MNRWALLIPLMLLMLKPLQLCFETDPFSAAEAAAVQQLGPVVGTSAAEAKIAGEPLKAHGGAAFVGLGVLRRLDDASFWMALGCVIASGRVLSVLGGPLAAPAGRSRGATAWFYILWGYALLWTLGYIAKSVRMHESVAWTIGRWDPGDARFWGVAVIQFLEGVLVIAAVLLVCVASMHAYRVAEQVAPPPGQRHLPGTMANPAAGSDLITACVSSFPLVFVAVAVLKVVTADLGFAREAPLVFGIKLVGQMAFAAVPLVGASLAAVLGLWGARRRYQLAIGKDLVSITVT
ncbi:MAG: hypothetical protein WD749_00550 [Phycisphaerales bacterium]